MLPYTETIHCLRMDTSFYNFLVRYSRKWEHCYWWMRRFEPSTFAIETKDHHSIARLKSPACSFGKKKPCHSSIASMQSRSSTKHVVLQYERSRLLWWNGYGCNLSLRYESLTHSYAALKCFNSRGKRGSACTTYVVPCPRNHPHMVWKHCTRLGTIERTIFGRVLFESSIHGTKEKESSTRSHLLNTRWKLEVQVGDGVEMPFLCVKAE